jgi:hypothetical protein
MAAVVDSLVTLVLGGRKREDSALAIENLSRKRSLVESLGANKQRHLEADSQGKTT